MKRVFFAVLGLVMTLGVSVSAAHAAASPLIGTFGNWQAFKTKQSGKFVCLVSSKPIKSLPTNVKRGDIFILVSDFQDGRVKNQVQVLVGYPFKTGSSAQIKVDDKTFDMFTKGENAWSRDKATDHSITAAFRKGTTAVVTGVSKRGTKTTDTYSLKGISAALNAITKACPF